MRTNNLIARLEKRKRDMIMTLEHIRQQQMEVDRNAESMDGWARQRRRALLADLAGWYDDKLKQIDGVIHRITQPDRFAWSKQDAGAPAQSQARGEKGSFEPRFAQRGAFNAPAQNQTRGTMLAREIMTKDMVSIGSDASVKTLAALLKNNHLSAAPVADRAGKLVGVAADGDILAHCNDYNDTVEAIMQRDVVSVTEDQPIAAVARIMSDRKLELLAVIRDGAVVGIISRDDLVSAFGIGLHQAEQSPIYDL